MPKTIKLEPHLDSNELENLYRKARDRVLRSHYQILWLISEGKSTTQVMEVTGYSRGWIQRLARRYNSDGARALGDGRHGNPGAKDRALLSVDQQEELRGSVNRRVANVTTVGQEAIQSFGELSGKKSSQPIDGSSKRSAKEPSARRRD